MPNLLAHYGSHGALTGTVLRGVDTKWILLGCALPDVPWILQRTVRILGPGVVDPYQLRLYAAVQASLFFCLVLALVLALLAERPGPVFVVLALNALLHLLLDAVQIKWATGVHLLAPFSWSSWSQDLFWPESATTLVLTAAGVAFLGWRAWRPGGASIGLRRPSPLHGLAAAAALAVYGALPIAFLGRAEAAGTHYVDVLRRPSERTGRYLELDRVRYVDRPEGDVIRTFAREEIRLRGVDLRRSGTVSARGRFLGPDALEVIAVHRHRSALRDLASYVALAVLVLVWWRALRRRPPPAIGWPGSAREGRAR